MKFKLRNAVIGVFAYLLLIGFVYHLHPILAGVALIYVAGCMLIARILILKAELRQSRSAVEFSRSGAINALGVEWVSFQHVFFSADDVLGAYRIALSDSLKSKLDCSGLDEIILKDVDREFGSSEVRTFWQSVSHETIRKTGFRLLCAFSRTINIQSVRLWILVSGVRDPNKLFWRYVFSPFTSPMVILPYLKRRYNPLSDLTTIHPGLFNEIDILNQTRAIQYIAFETLVEVLDSFGVDTSDLKQQKGNVMQINVKGGQANFGSVVQGALNKVAGSIRGVK